MRIALHSGSRRSKSASLSDLYNFEEARFEGSQYILTSPRSLEVGGRFICCTFSNFQMFDLIDW